MHKNLTLICGATLLLLNACTSSKETATAGGPNALSKQDKSDGWRLLFDGKTTKGWHTYNRDTVSSNWKVMDGALVMDATAKGPQNRGDIITNDAFENYELSVEWKISEAGNSGIIFNVKEDTAFKNTYNTGPEMQVLDNIKAQDNKKENHLAGLLYDMTGTAAQSNPKPVGEWNEARILQKNGHLTFYFNGTKTLDIQQGSDEWKAMLDASKFKGWKAFNLTPKGKIAFQDHGHAVWFRNIKVREL